MTDTTVYLPVPELDGLPSPALSWLVRPRYKNAPRWTIELNRHVRALSFARESAELLESMYPGSVARLNEKILNVADGGVCPAAQTCGYHYDDAPSELKNHPKSFGFRLSQDLTARHMNLAWRRVIREYRTKAD